MYSCAAYSDVGVRRAQGFSGVVRQSCAKVRRPIDHGAARNRLPALTRRQNGVLSMSASRKRTI